MFKPGKNPLISMDKTPLSLPIELSQTLTLEAKRAGISKQELIRQMIRYCLAEMASTRKEHNGTSDTI